MGYFTNLLGSGSGSSASVFLAGDGSAAAPSYSFTSETDTGLYLSAANTLAFSTAGALRGSINGSGLWTLGTVDGNQIHRWNGRGWQFYLPSTGTDSGQMLMQGQASGHGNLNVYLNIASGNTTADAYFIAAIDSGATWIWGLDNSDSDSFALSSGTTLGTNNALHITAAGLVTIGTGTSNRNRINSSLATNGAVALTMLNGPTGTSGNPAVWMQININGTNYVIPAWSGA